MSDPPGTHVFSLNSALGVSLFGDSQPASLSFPASQTCFAVSGSYADNRNLRRRWKARAGNADGIHEQIFIHSSLPVQQVIEPTDGNLAATQPCGHAGDILVGLDTAHGQVYAASDPRQSDIQSLSGTRYRLFISHGPSYVIYDYIPCRQTLSPSEFRDTPSLMYNSVNTTFDSLSNVTSSFPMQFDSSFPSPFPSIYPGDWDQDWDSVSDRELESPPPLASPFSPVDYTHPTLDVEMELPSDVLLADNQRRPRTDRMVALLGVLQQLRRLKFTVLDLLTVIINGEDGFQGYRNTLFSSRHRASLVGLLERLIQDKKGGPIVTEWMYPHALHLVCERIHKEMEAAKPKLRMSTGEVTPNFIEEWDIYQIMKPVADDITPTLRTVLEAAGESKASSAKLKSPKSKNRSTALLIIMAQIHFLRSRCSAKVPIGLGLQSWACGTSKQMIDVLHRTCLTVSYTSISSMVEALAARSIERAKDASVLPHALTYDNINISSSIFVEQGPNAMSKVQSGTFAVVYELLNARAEDMNIGPLVDNLQQSSPLDLTSLRMTPQAAESYASQTAITIIRILSKYVNGFEIQLTDAYLQRPQRRPLPLGHKTVFHPLRATTIEEASIDGNLLVHDDVYLVQLGHSPDNLNNMAIPTINDQLTNAHIQGGQHLRHEDVSPWERREIFQLGFGSFHLAMNLLWCVLETHRGTLNQTGSLTHFFAMLEKTRLGGEHPDYHTLLAALTQILHGLILNAWLVECAYPSLDDFAKANPTPTDLLLCAHLIIQKYASPGPICDDVNPKARPKASVR